MADEPRRSGRSTKGQHKNLDMVDETPHKKTKAKAQPKDKPPKPSVEPTPAPEEEEEEIIRCICGEYEEEEDIERDMICCDQCSAWQHNDCMGLTFPPGEAPDQYFCEQCKPEDHPVLLAKIKNGEKPWEEVAERRRKEAEELKQSRRKKGKKGKRGRPSEPKVTKEPKEPKEPKEENSTPARTPAPRVSATPVTTPVAPLEPPPPGPAAVIPHPPPEKNSHVPNKPPASAQKRKLSEQEASPPDSGPKAKQQKISPPAKSATPPAKKTPENKESPAQAPAKQPTPAADEAPKPEGPKTLDQIVNPARRNAASALTKVFVDQISDALAGETFKMPEGKTGEEVGQQLGIAVEEALYQNLMGGGGEATSEAYKIQLRAILFNVKKNPSLRDRLLVGSLSPDELSRMSSQDMASEELQQKDAEIKREAERQHIIIQEQGPRIRRTHKGEELVEDDQTNVSTEPVFSAIPRRVTETDASPAQSPISPTTKQPETDGQKANKDTTPTEPTPHDEHFPTRSHSPGTGQEQVFPEVETHIRQPIPTGKVQADAEIDQLLKDDDEPDSPPYSPKEHHDEGAIWHGKIVMNPITEFSCSAKHVGGADLSGRIPWNELIPSSLVIDGRIKIEPADTYLCGLRFSHSTDVTVVCISSPESPKEKSNFDKLFNYFTDRERCGVVGKHPMEVVKDTYLIPIEAGSTKKPEFIELLDNITLEDPPLERVFLVVFAVKTGESNPPSVQPQSQQGSMEPVASASPLTVTSGTPLQPFATPGPRHSSQYAATPTPAFHGAQHPPAPAPYAQQPHPSHPQPQIQNPLSQLSQYNQSQPELPTEPFGLPAAIQVLGAQATDPAIQALLQKAPTITETQLTIVRDILIRQPQAATDYKMLMHELMGDVSTAPNANGNGLPPPPLPLPHQQQQQPGPTQAQTQ
ncbi:transcription factor S-II, central domain-containing protein [Aspergillus multicolor]|uniref:putative PHD finger domain protein n=1 Tax=Aspergillus multicolor TaxID=41759 RepID=UPI003CCDB455